ncbi:hypothetical protein PGC35_10340 [Psychrobacillus sp. PGGUH221]|uniref:hypothetical protein n=1 Tax=Psychrobacillus sp. PGGUH221 TaxID=3020058 RepID=UPI0035C68749
MPNDLGVIRVGMGTFNSIQKIVSRYTKLSTLKPPLEFCSKGGFEYDKVKEIGRHLKGE